MNPKELYAEKSENITKALNREACAYIPTAITNNGGGFHYSGVSVFDVTHKPEEYAKGLTSFMGDMWVDMNILSGLTTSPGKDAAFPTSENRIAENGTLTHRQNPPMKADEYDQLIADPKAFIANVLLPRKFPYLFEDKEKTRELLKIYAAESVDHLVLQFGATAKYVAEAYGVVTNINVGAMLDTPLDHLFDFFRGFRGTLTDLRRQPDKVKAAAEAIWEYQNKEMMSKPYNKDMGYPFQPCHIPAYLSPKQYKELYWPYEKQLIEWVYNSGSKIFIILEGNWKNIYDCFKEVPKDSCILAVDDDDFIEAYKELGDYQIMCGGLKMSDCRLKKFEDIKDDIKKVFDACGNTGWIFTTDKSFVTPGDVNETLVECFNFAHEYSKEKNKGGC